MKLSDLRKKTKNKKSKMFDNVKTNSTNHLCGTSSDYEKDFKKKYLSPNSKVNSELNSKVNSKLNSKVNSELNSKVNSINKLNSKLNSKVNSKLNSKVNSNLTLKLTQKSELDYQLKELTDLQKKVLLYIYDLSKTNADRISDPIYFKTACLNLNIKKNSLRITITRFIERAYLYRVNFVNGRNGYSTYRLTDEIYNKIAKVNSKVNSNLTQSNSNLFSNNNNLINKDNIIITSSGEEIVSTKNQEILFDLSDDWTAIDVTPLEKIKFTENHVLQLSKKSKLSPEIIQDSIKAFAFDLFENKLIETIKTPLKMIMGLLIKGQPYNPPDNYESEKDRAMRLYYEKKRRDEDVRRQREEKLIEIELSSWTVGLSETEKELFVSEGYKKLNPESGMAKKIMEADLKSYFLENVWPEKIEEIYQLRD